MLYLHTPKEVACHCVSFIRKVNFRSGDTTFDIEVFKKSSKLDNAFKFIKISGDNDATEVAMPKDAWEKAKQALINSRWQVVTNTNNGEGICVSI